MQYILLLELRGHPQRWRPKLEISLSPIPAVPVYPAMAESCRVKHEHTFHSQRQPSCTLLVLFEMRTWIDLVFDRAPEFQAERYGAAGTGLISSRPLWAWSTGYSTASVSAWKVDTGEKLPSVVTLNNAWDRWHFRLASRLISTLLVDGRETSR